MRNRFLALIGALAVVIAASLVSALIASQAPVTTATRGTAAPSGPAAKTPWGDPDLQGIWTDVFRTPLQRPTQYADKEFFTDGERAELDRKRAEILAHNAKTAPETRTARGTEVDVANAYNNVFTSPLKTGKRTSLVVDPPNGRIPAYTPEAKKRADAYYEFQLALLQATVSCKEHFRTCRGGTYGPPSPRRTELPPVYNTSRLNRTDGPEDRSLLERCLAAGLPDFSGFRRIVQSPGAVSIFYDVGQGQGWERVIPITDRPHLPPQVRQWWGDSRGHWDGNTLVVDVTNFTAKRDALGGGGSGVQVGSRENLHLIERWTRRDGNTLEYAVTVDDPTTWTKPWTVKQEMARQNEQANRIYYEPRCSDTNYGLAGMLSNSRAEERLFAEGKGPDPATRDTASGGGSSEEDAERDPLGGE